MADPHDPLGAPDGPGSGPGSGPDDGPDPGTGRGGGFGSDLGRHPAPHPAEGDGLAWSFALDADAVFEALGRAAPRWEEIDQDADLADELAARDRDDAPAPVGVAGAVAGTLPAGPGLAAWLSGCDPAGVSDYDAPAVAAAFRRVASWAQAGELAMVAQIAARSAARDPDCGLAADGRPAHVTRDAAAQVSLELVLSSAGAEAWTGLALTLAWRLPGTAAALAAGRIDLVRARILAEAVAPLSDEAAAAVEALVLPRAGDQTYAQLHAAVRRAVIAADPDGAEQRRQAAERRAKVALYPDQDCTATLTGTRLPAAHAAAAMARLSALARAMKAAGAGGGLDLLRAHAYLGLLLGTLPLIPPPAGGPPDADPPDGGEDDGAPPPGADDGPSGSAGGSPGTDTERPAVRRPRPLPWHRRGRRASRGPRRRRARGSRAPPPGRRGAGAPRRDHRDQPPGPAPGPGPGPGRAAAADGHDPPPASPADHDPPPASAGDHDPPPGTGHGRPPGSDLPPAGPWTDAPPPADTGLPADGDGWHDTPPPLPPGYADWDPDRGDPLDHDHYADPGIIPPWPPAPTAIPPAASPSPGGTGPAGPGPGSPRPARPGPGGEPARRPAGCWTSPCPGPPSPARPTHPGHSAASAPSPPPGPPPRPPGHPQPRHPVARHPHHPRRHRHRRHPHPPPPPPRPSGPAGPPGLPPHPGTAPAEPAPTLGRVTVIIPAATLDPDPPDPDPPDPEKQDREKQDPDQPGRDTPIRDQPGRDLLDQAELARIRARITAAARRARDTARRHADADRDAPGGCAHATASPAYRPPPRIREYVIARDQTCRNPRCGQPAWRADLDHTRPHHHGGPTCPCNLGGACRADHQLKQLPGWTLTQPEPGTFQWTTPAGRTYATRPDPHYAG